MSRRRYSVPVTPSTQQLTVLDPSPQLTAVTVSPANPIVCQPVTMTAVNPGGAPTLQYAWQVENSLGSPVFSQTNTQTSQVWDTSAAPAAADSYTARLTLSNGSGSVVRTAPFTLTAPPTLPLAGQFTPTFDPFTAGTVTFHVIAPGATEWNWDFDGDGVFPVGNWTSDPILGPNPTHSYSTTGLRQVRVQVRNCLNPTGVISAPVAIDITQVTPLVAHFLAVCPFGSCFFTTAENVPFTDASTGAETYEYDWDGNGTVDQTSSTPVTSHRFTVANTNPGYTPKLTVKRGSESNTFTHPLQIFISPASPASITISGPTTGTPGASISLSATASSCTPDAVWNWSATGGGTVTGNGSAITVSFATTGSKVVTASNSACGSASDTHTINVSTDNPPPPPPPPPPGGLAANFTVSAQPIAGQPVSFNGSSSTGSPTLYAWSWGDGTAPTVSASPTATHTFAAAGTYSVELEVSKPGNCTTGFCSATKVLPVTVGTGGPPPPLASFTTSASCTNEFGSIHCEAEVGEVVTFTDTSSGTVSTRSWEFGDGGTGSSAVITHAFANPGNVTVRLTVSGAGQSSDTSLAFTITGVAAPDYALLLPFFAWSQGTLVQVSDFYAYNPGNEPLVLTVRFYKRGTPDITAQPRQLTIAPHAARYVEDALGAGLFNLPNPMIGFLYFTWEGPVEPAVNGINRTFAAGSAFGQSFPAVRVPRAPATVAAASTFPDQHVIGMADNATKTSTLGLTNPYSVYAKVELSFFNRAGQPLRQNVPQTLAAFGQKIFQIGELRALGVTGDDFRVVVKTITGGPVVPFGSVVRVGSQDQSYISSSDASQPRSFLLGVVNSNGVPGSVWRTDAVLFNPSSEPLAVDAIFTPVGLTAVSTRTETIQLAPLETRRLEDVIFLLWGIRSGGTLRFSSAGVRGTYPVVLGERYEITRPSSIFGQAFSPLFDGRAATVGQSLALLGLRHDAANRTWLYFYNPGTTLGQATLIWRAPGGTELARTAIALGAGIGRQIAPPSLPAAVTALGGAFTVEAKVTAGQMLGVGQVVALSTSDPTQITGIAF